MKVLFIKSGCHYKNFNFILKCKNISFTIANYIHDVCNYNFEDYDCIFSPCDIIDVSQYPNIKFIFGPHCCLFPNEQNLDLVKGKNSIYIQPSYWPINFWHCCDIKTKEINLIPFAFGVDTEKFNFTKTIQERTKVFVYFKRRNPSELNYLLNFLQTKNIDIKIFDYVSRYSEEEYFSYLQNSKYGIWLDAHESQGFALQEALSCNVPLLVWNISSMNQEHNSTYNNIPATTIPYWDVRCGEYFYNENDLEYIYNLFIKKLETYKPRDFILENLTIDKCENNLIKLIENI